MVTASGEGVRWRRRGVSAALLEAVAVLLPGAAGVLCALAVPTLAEPSNRTTLVLAWAGGLIAGVAVAVMADRLLRRVLPLVVLLRLSLVFPDRAPSRFKVALRAGTLRNLDEKLAHVAACGVEGDPSQAAARMLELLSALTRYDRRTRGHSERVRAFADLIAGELKLPALERDRLRWSALLHDIGKLHVDVGILNKQGRLDEAEWEAVRAHPHVGARIAAPLLPWLGPWGTAIEHHHERWDGTGYPHGVSGDDIALGARIVSVADAFEVMTAVRSYKKPLDVAEAREELLRHAGTQFDPEVVRALFMVSMTRLRWVVGPAALVASLPGARRAWAVRRTMADRPAVRAGFAALFAALAIPATEGSTDNESAPDKGEAMAGASEQDHEHEQEQAAHLDVAAGGEWALVLGTHIERATAMTAPSTPADHAGIDGIPTAPTPPASESPAVTDGGAEQTTPPGWYISRAARSGGRPGHGAAVSSTAHAVEKPSGR